jgi:hypothetical protein
LWQTILMSLFCFLWTPLFCLFWSSVQAPEDASGLRFSSSGGIWALLLGSLAAFIRFLLGSFVSPGAFGLSRWLSACVDIVALPGALPLLACALLIRLRALGPRTSYAGFALLWLIPGAAMSAVRWSALKDPSLLILAPVLRTAIAAGIPVLAAMTGKPRGLFTALRVLAGTALPLLATTVYWAFFSQLTWLGLLLLIPALAPMAVSTAINFLSVSGKAAARTSGTARGD